MVELLIRLFYILNCKIKKRKKIGYPIIILIICINLRLCKNNIYFRNFKFFKLMKSQGANPAPKKNRGFNY